MKKLINPTKYFFQQAQDQEDQHYKGIDELVSKLLDCQRCPLCRGEYNLRENLPRIMVHCGHTFCTPCLLQFYEKNHGSRSPRIRCPMCLKLVKQLDSIDRLPINHSIFKRLIQKENQAQPQRPPLAYKSLLFSEFERAQKTACLANSVQRYDPDSGLPFCVFHPERVEHFYCETHTSTGCRVCIEVGHSHPECRIQDIYLIEDPRVIESIFNRGGKQMDQSAAIREYEALDLIDRLEEDSDDNHHSV